LFRKESVDKPVENYVDNLWIFAQKEVESLKYVDINRYKLIKFAPKMEIVDKVREVFIIRE